MTTNTKPPENRDDWWPCACTRGKTRDPQGRMVTKQIKMHHPVTTKCNTCKCKRPPNWPPRSNT